MMELSDPHPVPLTGGPTLRWGIQAPGVIAAQFVRALHRHTDQPVVAAASRSEARARAFADEHGIAAAYGNYDQLLSDRDVDIVYIASPHSHHCEMAVAAIEAGKHVLVEKPLAASAAEGARIRDAAHRHGRFAMEAMHTRFHPRTQVLADLLEQRRFGDILLVSADLGTSVAADPEHRLFRPDLAGGALLDIGVYSIWFAVFVLGRPAEVNSYGRLHPTGVDDQSVTVLAYAGGQQAVASTSLMTFGSGIASVAGVAGRALIHSRHAAPGDLTIFDADNRPVARFTDRSGISTAADGLCRQAVWAARHVADGLTESPMHPLSTSIQVLEIIDRARAGIAAANAEKEASAGSPRSDGAETRGTGQCDAPTYAALAETAGPRS